VAIVAKMAYLAKMAEMAINRQNCQIVKNSNEIFFVQTFIKYSTALQN